MDFLNFIKSIPNKPYHTRLIYFWLAIGFSFMISISLWIFSVKNLIQGENGKAEVVNKEVKAEFKQVWDTIKDTSFNIKSLTADIAKEFKKQDNSEENKLKNNLIEVTKLKEVIDKKPNKLPVE